MHATVCKLLIFDYQDILVRRDGSKYFWKGTLASSFMLKTSTRTNNSEPPISSGPWTDHSCIRISGDIKRVKVSCSSYSMC